MVDAMTSPTQRRAAGPFPPLHPSQTKGIWKETSMDKTESTVRNMLTAIEAPLYDIGVLSERGMLPGLNGMLAAAVPDRLCLLKHRNAHGSHIYPPIGEHLYEAQTSGSRSGLRKLVGLWR